MQAAICLEVKRPINLGLTRVTIYVEPYASRKSEANTDKTPRINAKQALIRHGFPVAAQKEAKAENGLVHPKIYLVVYPEKESALQAFLNSLEPAEVEDTEEAQIQRYTQGFQVWIIRNGQKAKIIIPLIDDSGQMLKALEFKVDLSRIKSIARHPLYKEEKGMKYDENLKAQYYALHPNGMLPKINKGERINEASN